MTLVSQSISLFVSSDPESGSKNLSQTVHSFSVDMNPSLDIKQRYTPYLRLLKASVWWSIPNINQILYNNNRLVISNDGVNNLTLDLENTINFTMCTGETMQLKQCLVIGYPNTLLNT